ncbi:MAG: hypothetical protein JWL83_1368 [Actinomycetia bacterium]|jgi:uncharacterized membrane protein (UPF0127 family)|nr:hypothetical protein [Actinomycetes bacterium]
MAWLVRGEDVLAAAELALTRQQRRHGLVGRDDLDGVLVLRPCKQVHTFGMKFPIDVAFCDGDGFVLHTCTLSPWRVSKPILRSRLVVEARAGAFDRWKVRPGDVIEVCG